MAAALLVVGAKDQGVADGDLDAFGENLADEERGRGAAQTIEKRPQDTCFHSAHHNFCGYCRVCVSAQ